MIKDMVVTVTQLPMKSMVIDVVITDIPVNFRILLSRSWGNKLGGTMQMDMTYAIVPIMGGE